MARIQVLEGLSIPGSPDRENDDAMGATTSIAFVLDGVTSLVDSPLTPSRSDAAWIAHLARDLLLKPGAGDATDLRGLLTNVARQLGEAFESQRNRAPAARHELPYTTISIIGVEPGKLHIGFVGDSRILIETADDEVHNFGINPSRTAHETNLARKMIAARKEQKIGHEAMRATVMPELRRSREIVNTPEGFWLLGIDPEVGRHATVTSVALSGPATVLLATDGFYALTEDYERYGDRELIATAQTIGLQTLARELRHIEDADPDGARYPRMKKSDDATALLVRIEP